MMKLVIHFVSPPCRLATLATLGPASAAVAWARSPAENREVNFLHEKWRFIILLVKSQPKPH